MSEDTHTHKRELLQILRIQLAMTIQPLIISLIGEAELLVKQFTEMDKSCFLEGVDFSEDEFASVIKIMLDSSTDLREDMKEFRELIDTALINLPQSEDVWDIVFTYGLHVCHDVRPLYGSISGSTYLFLELLPKKSDTESDIFYARLHKILEMTQELDAFVNKMTSAFLQRKVPEDNE